MDFFSHIFSPLHTLWWIFFGESLNDAIIFLYGLFDNSSLGRAIGPYGLAIITLTLAIKLVLAPLFQLQLSMTKKTSAEQLILKPQVAEINKRFKDDPVARQNETMKLYNEHGINPLAPMMGCLPVLVQFPVLIALYWVFLGFHGTEDHFLFVTHLTKSPFSHIYLGALIIPLLTAATQFIQGRMLMPKPNSDLTGMEAQMQQMSGQMIFLLPVMTGYFAMSTPAGLGLYWTTSNIFAIVQQYLINRRTNANSSQHPPKPHPA